MADTGLPLVSRLTSVLRVLALSLGVGCLFLAVTGATLARSAIFDPSSLWFNSLSALLSVPFFCLSHHYARRSRLQSSALSLFAGLYILSLLGAVARGGLTPGWYFQPLLAIIVTSTLGSVPGLLMTMVGAAAILASPWMHGAVATPGSMPVPHSLGLAALTLLCGLTGVLLHRLLLNAVGTGDELRQREKLLRHALRLETVGDLASMVVHQLRNHFQVILGHVAMGARQGPGEHSRRLGMIGETLEEAGPLLDQLLGLAHPEDGEPRPCDLTQLAADFSEKARRILPASMELDQQLAPGQLPVHLDPRGLEHALLNLVINARDAMAGKGTLVVATGGEGERAWISVADSGPGIPEGHLEQIFDPYFTTKPVGQGTGLGLTAVSRFVHSNQGRVRVDSVEGRGTTFTLIFPTRGQRVSGRSPAEQRATG